MKKKFATLLFFASLTLFFSLQALATQDQSSDENSKTLATSISPNIKAQPPKLSKKFSGDDIAAVVSKMKKLRSKVGIKSEFESSEEYKSRVDKNANTEEDLELVIKPQNVETKYDADNKELHLSIATDPMGMGGFILRSTDKRGGSYMATNGFGAKVNVTKFSRKVVKFEPISLACSKEFFGSNSRPTSNDLTLSVDSETAKRMKNNIAVLYTASPTTPYYLRTDQAYPATYKMPMHVDSIEDIIYADINKITLFNYKTGEVFLESEMDDLNCKPE